MAFAKQWGMNVAVQDLHTRDRGGPQAGRQGRARRALARRLGGDRVRHVELRRRRRRRRPRRARLHRRRQRRGVDGRGRQRAGTLDPPAASPWLAFGGIPAPYAGLFNATGSEAALLDPNGPSLGQTLRAAAADIVPPVPVTNVGQYGYALNAATSPPASLAAQAHLGTGLDHDRPGPRLERRRRAHADQPVRDDVLRLRDPAPTAPSGTSRSG